MCIHSLYQIHEISKTTTQKGPINSRKIRDITFFFIKSDFENKSIFLSYLFLSIWSPTDLRNLIKFYYVKL